MKRIRMISVTILLAMLVSSLNLFAQSPAQWDFKTKRINDSVAELIFYNVKEMDSCISWKEGVIRVPVSCYRSKHGFGHNDSSLRLNRVP